jgi:hypothetical protein
MDIRGFVGKRVLLASKVSWNENGVEEFKVLEVSPSGNWVKLMNTNTRKFWKAVASCTLVEVLKDLEAKPKE